MSLGVATNTALSGLRFTSLGTKLVAENIANAEVAGYGPRQLLATGTISAVRSGATLSTNVVRDVDPLLLQDTRSADAGRHDAQTRLAALSKLENAFGIPGEFGAFNTLLTSFETSLRQAATTPDSNAALRAVAQNAARLVSKFNTTGDQIQAIRQQADTAISNDVQALNAFLGQVTMLNRDIQRQTLLGGDPFALMDQREQVVSEIAKILPVTEIPREDNRIMLLSARGEVLVDFDHAEFTFAKTPSIAADDTLTAGAISAVYLNGRALGPQDQTLQTGTLGANLAVRDTLAPEAQADLDLLAQDLMDRFTGPTADTSLSPGELGLFTLDGASMLPADPTGLSSQMRLSSLVDPATGDGLWRLRSGLNAAIPGPMTDPATLESMITALTSPRELAPGLPRLSLADSMAERVSSLATKRLGAETDLASAQASFTTKQQTLTARGVDTDAEMQDLLRLERAYAANARVLSTVDEMMRNLLEI